MLSDPLLAYRDTPTSTVHSRAFDRLPQTGSDTYYKATDHNAGRAETIRIGHQTVGKGSNKRTRHLVSIEAPQLVSASEEDHALPWAKIQLVIDLPESFMTFGEAKIEDMFEQFTGLVRGNSINDASVSIDYDEFFRPFISGQS